MCMKGRKNNSELYKDVHLFEFVVSYAISVFSENDLWSQFLLTQEKTVYLFTVHFQGQQQLYGACQVNKTKSSLNCVGVYTSAGLQNKLLCFIVQKVTAWPLYVLFTWSNFSQTLLFLSFFPVQSFFVVVCNGGSCLKTQNQCFCNAWCVNRSNSAATFCLQLLCHVKKCNRSFSFSVLFHLIGTLWNLSSYEPLKMVIINHGLQTMTNEVIIPHSGWEHEPNEDSKPRDAEWTTVFKNTSGCLRYTGLNDSILHILVS